MKNKILFITNEYPGVTNTGGIGAAVQEAANILSDTFEISIMVIINSESDLQTNYKKNISRRGKCYFNEPFWATKRGTYR